MRQIILDTETTGLSPKAGHRIIEIGCIEMINRRFTRNNLHLYINPEREIDAGAMSVHGISNEFLSDKPVFKAIIEELIAYIDGAELVIHNAPFDVNFLNHEFSLANKKYKAIRDYCSVFDTLPFARKKHPGQQNSLDALCKRYGVDNSTRDLHGGLLDARLLGEVYLLMTGGQNSLFGGGGSGDAAVAVKEEIRRVKKDRKPLKIIRATPDEEKKHLARLASIDSTIVWE